MEKTVIECDRCKKVIEGRIGYIAYNFKERKERDLMIDNPYEKYDFCEECMNQIADFINGNETKKKSKGVKESTQKNERKRIDHGKIRALKNAGWTNKDIAQEMGMTTNNVANSLSTHKELKK